MATHRTAVHYLGSYCTAALLALGTGNAVASSFALIEQSVSGMGTAYAVGSSGIDDASTVYFNPAGMSRLHGSHLSGGLHIVDLNTDFKGSAEYANTGAAPPVGFDGVPIDGRKKLNLDTTELVPSGYISHQYSDKVWFGIGVNAPFGLKTDYDSENGSVATTRSNRNYSPSTSTLPWPSNLTTTSRLVLASAPCMQMAN